MAVLKDYMSTNLQSCESSDNLTTLAKHMKEEDVGFLPIVENNKYVGVVTDRDIVVKGLAKGSAENITASEIMTESVVTGYPDMSIEEAGHLMQEHQIQRLLVIENDDIKGVVSLGDLGVKNADQVAGNVVSEMKKGQGNN